MTKEMIEFLDIKVIETKFELNNNFDEEDIEYEVGFKPNFYINQEDSYDGIVRVTAKIFDEDYEKNNKPFSLILTIQAHFNSQKTEKPLSDFYMNCLNITIPYIRSYVTTFTSLAGINPVTFPPVNIYDLMDKMEAENND